MNRVDLREPPDIREDLVLNGWQAEMLDIADYELNLDSGLLLIERKTISDLLTSIGQGRLASQIIRMLRVCKRSVLLIEGIWQYSGGYVVINGCMTHWLWKGVQAFLLTVQNNGICLWNSPSLISTPGQIWAIEHYYSKHTHKAISDLVYREKGPEALLACLPGVGPERAEKLLEYFGSVREVINAQEEELIRVNGIGKKLAREIVETLTKGGSNGHK